MSTKPLPAIERHALTQQGLWMAMPRKKLIEALHGKDVDLGHAERAYERRDEEAKHLEATLKMVSEEKADLERRLKNGLTRMDDLKTRLATAELENARLRGYVARVQEDDVVREDLITTGEPDGEQRLVPKREPTRFAAPDHLSGERYHGGEDQSLGLTRREPRPPRRHWVTYGVHS